MSSIRKRTLLPLLILLAVWPAALGFSADLPPFEAKTIDGETFRFADLIGEKVVVFDFWATYCIHCRPQLDALEKLYQKYKERDFEVVIISVDTPQNIGKIKPYFRSRGYSFPVVLDTDSQIARVLKPVNGLPYTLLVNLEGEIVFQHEGYKKGEEKVLEEKIVACLEPVEEDAGDIPTP